MLKLETVYKDYLLGKTTVNALIDINLEIGEGEFLSIVGPSGSGKTTLLNLIGGIDQPTKGNIYSDGINLTELSDDEMTEFRLNRMGFIFQSFNLIPVLNVFENIEFPLILMKKGREERKKIVLKLIEDVELSELIQHRPDELSGGQRQRVAIARALVTSPEIVLADEPTSNLDHTVGRKILEIMKKLNREYNTTFIFSSHDPQVFEFAERKVILQDGRIVGEE